jgi:hypothetical protein
MREMSSKLSPWVSLAAVASALPGCGEAGGGAASIGNDHERTDASRAQEEKAPVPLSLGPVLGTSLDEAGNGALMDIDGAEMCVSRVRHLDGKWEDFVEVPGPCVTTVPGQPAVLTVPPRREILITVHADGYRPIVIPAVTGERLMQAQFGIYLTADGESGPLASGRTMPELGDVWAGAIAVNGGRFMWLGGASLSLEPGSGTGPFYALGGVLQEGEHTPPGGDLAPGSPDFLTTVSAASFFDVAEGEYRVQISHPTASCQAFGFLVSAAIWGFPADRENEVRAPVLNGHGTTILFECRCHVRGLTPDEIAALDPATCAPQDRGG